MRKLAILFASAFMYGLPTSAATLINGSLEGPEGIFQVPHGWEIARLSPDTGSTSDPQFLLEINPGASFDGGTWVGLASSDLVSESFGQSVSDFVLGATYEISYLVANAGCCRGAYPGSNAIRTLLNGTVANTGSVRPVEGLWYEESFQFIANSETLRIDFETIPSEYAYLLIDGISLEQIQIPAIPLPASGVLLLFSTAAMFLFRRKRESHNASAMPLESV